MSLSPALSTATSSSHPEILSGLPRRLALGLGATLVVALAAHIAFPLPFTPVPFTLQPLAVLLVGLVLGPLDGALAMLAYLAEGAAGLPVFSPTGPGGLLQLLGPTGGYLLAYPLVAFVCGCSRGLAAQVGPFLSAFAGCVLATALLFTSGALWLAHFAHLGAHTVWMAAVLPFLPGEAVKILAASGTFRAVYSHNRAR